MEHEMKSFRIKLLILPTLIGILTVCGPIMAQEEDAPASVAAALTIKLAAFEKNIAESEGVVVYVLSAPEVAAELQKGIGTRIGSTTLTDVQSGDKLPESVPSILYIGENAELDSALTYTRSRHILSVTHRIDLVKSGVTIGFGVGNDGKPVIRLNLTSTIEEGLSWNPAIMKVAKTEK